MCGIFGIQSNYCDIEFQQRMSIMDRKLKHRGPDDSGMFTSDSDNLYLGHRRLSIIDLSQHGHQPMTYMGRYTIVFNGEIYNYRELKDKLSAKGYKFRSATDTEVILAAYDNWGECCVNHFNGMWAFCIWDNISSKLFCSRDRFGIKPFYYIKSNKLFAFASEIKALTAAFSENTAKDYDVLDEFIGRTYLPNSDKTFFRNIYELEQASNIIVRNGKIEKMYRYYKTETVVNEDINYRINRDLLSETLIDSINLRMRADVKVGSCLSGGIDSSSIASIIAKELNLNIGTYSAIYRESNINEEPYVDAVIEDTGLPNFKVMPDSEGIINTLRDIIYYQDEPPSGIGVMSQWEVMKMAANNGVKVMLDGQGSDELFAGYVTYFRFFLNDILNLDRISDSDFIQTLSTLRKTDRRQFIQAVKYTVKRKLLNRVYALSGRNGFDDSLTLDIKLIDQITANGLPRLLHYEDRNSMAFSLEARVPFLDYRVVDLALSMPENHKIHRGITKYILRDALKGVLNNTVRTRRNKLGFATPFNKWLQKDRNLMDYIQEMPFQIKDEISELFSKHHFSEFVQNVEYHKQSQKMWNFLAAYLWYDTDFTSS